MKSKPFPSSPPNPSACRRRWIALASGAFLLASVTPSIAAHPPAVGVAFTITATNFVDVLKPETKRQCQEMMALELTNHLISAFPFLRWVQLGDTNQSVTAALNLEMYGEREPRFRSDNIRLRFLRAANGNWLPLSAPVFDELYAATASQPANDPSTLKADLKEKIRTIMTHPGNRTMLLEEFIPSVSLANELIADPPNQRCIVPVAWNELQAGSGSILKADFVSTNATGRKVPVQFDLELETEIPDGPWVGDVNCAVVYFSHPPIRKRDDSMVWHQLIPECLSRKIQGTFSLVMERHKRLTTVTRGGLFLTPH